MPDKDTPIYDSVVEDLDIDPELETVISHDDRFNKIKDAHPSDLLDKNGDFNV